MNNYKPGEYEEEIDLIELFWKLIENLKWIIIAAVIGAVAVGGLKYAKDTIDYKNAVAAKAVESETTTEPDALEKLANTLTPLELTQVDNYVAGMQDLDEKLAMTADMGRMLLNPYNATRIKMYFVVESQDDTKSAIIADVYRDYLYSAEFAGFMERVYENRYTQSQILDLMYVDNRNMLYAANGGVSGSSLAVYMYVPEGEDAQLTLNAIKDALNEKHSRTIGIAPHELNVVNENIYVSEDRDLKLFQMNTNKEINDARLSLLTTRNTFKDNQNAYLEALVAGTELEDEKPLPEIPSISKKFILLGLVLGAFVVCGIVCMMFIFSVKLSNADAFVNRFGGSLFGYVGAHSLRDRRKCKRSIEDQIKTVAAGIVLCCKQQSIDKLAFIGTDLSKLNADYLSQIESIVKDGGVEVVRLGNIFYEPDSLVSCAEIGKAVVVEGVGISIYDEISNEIVKANEYGIDLIGSVIL